MAAEIARGVPTRKRKYNKITDVQREILEKFFKEGMTGAGVLYSEAIGKASVEAGLSVEQVRKWIGNAKQKWLEDSNECQPSTKNAKVPGARGQTAYNMFCGEFLQSGGSGLTMKEKNRQAAEKWRGLSQAEKNKYKEAANNVKEPEISSLDDKQREKLIAIHRRNLIKEVLFLEDVGCDSCVIFKDPSGQVYNFGSTSGQSFLLSSPEINLKFRQYFSCTTSKYTYKDVQDLFNTKYSKAIQKPGSRVPYLRGGFSVINMPDGIPFKRPFHYGAQQLKAIMEKKEEIGFVIDEPANSTEGDGREMENEGVAGSPAVLELLAKIAVRERAVAVVERSEKITEEEVEVMDLVLSQGERLVLYSGCAHYFSDDAWLAVGHNMRHSSDRKGVILPVYTDADSFWLFYATHLKPSTLMKSGLGSKIKGFWLHEEKHHSYKLLKLLDTIVGKNIIRSEHGPLYYSRQFKASEGNDQYFELPDNFRVAILSVLRKNGVICNE